MKIKTNLVSGIIFIVVGVILLALLNSQVIVYGDTPFISSAKVMPFITEMVMIIGGIALVIQSLVFRKEKIVEFKWQEQKYVLFLISIYIIFAALMYFVGFLIAAIVFVIMMFIYYKNKNLLQLAVLCVLAVGIYFLFIYVFHISLPGFGGAR